MNLLNVLPGRAVDSISESPVVDGEIVSDADGCLSIGMSLPRFADDAFSENAPRCTFPLSPASSFSHVSKIVGLGANEQMSGIDAGWVVTGMSYDKAVWNGTVHEFVRSTVSEHVGFNSTTCSDHPVTMFVDGCGPVPTFVWSSDIHFGPETISDGDGTISHGANSNLVESYVPGSFARPGDTYIVAGRG